MNRLYAQDFYGWTQDQADALRRRSLNELDWDNLLEEIEDLGASKRRELESRLAVIISHVLKWKHQPPGRSRSWYFTLREQRAQVRRLLEDNPSLKAGLDEVMARAFESGVNAAADETKIPSPVFEAAGGMTFEEAMTSPAEWEGESRSA
jgi:hypothetical protein